MLVHTTLQTVREFISFGDYQITWTGYTDKHGTNRTFGELYSPYLEHCQSRKIPAHVCTPGAYAATIQTIEYEQYRQLIDQTHNTLSQRPVTNWTYNAFSAHLNLNPAERIALQWWMADRLAQLASIASGTEYRTSQPPIPVLYSPEHGKGKSLLVAALLKPFGHLARPCTIKQVCDPWHHSLWSRLLIADFEELSGARGANMEAFKHWCTTSTTSGREMHTERCNTVLQKVTHGIATSNVRPCDALHDPTGNRRLFQINVTHHLFDLSRHVQSVDVWRSIDPNYYPSSDEMRVLEQALLEQAITNPFGLWFEECSSELMSNYATSTALHCSYVGFCKMHNEKPTSHTAFGRCLGSLVAAGKLEKKKTKGMHHYRLTQGGSREGLGMV